MKNEPENFNCLKINTPTRESPYSHHHFMRNFFSVFSLNYCANVNRVNQRHKSARGAESERMLSLQSKKSYKCFPVQMHNLITCTKFKHATFNNATQLWQLSLNKFSNVVLAFLAERKYFAACGYWDASFLDFHSIAGKNPRCGIKFSMTRLSRFSRQYTNIAYPCRNKYIYFRADAARRKRVYLY